MRSNAPYITLLPWITPGYYKSKYLRILLKSRCFTTSGSIYIKKVSRLPVVFKNSQEIMAKEIPSITAIKREYSLLLGMKNPRINPHKPSNPSIPEIYSRFSSESTYARSSGVQAPEHPTQNINNFIQRIK